MKKINIDSQWQFHTGSPPLSPIMPIEKKTVNLPHDYQIASDVYEDAPGAQLSGYYGGTVGTYYKTIEFSGEEEIVLAEFDGCHMNAAVSLNGNQIARHHYGYSPFHVNLTPYIMKGVPNTLQVSVNNGAQPNARWYTGAGLYRGVHLRVSGKIHISPYGIYAKTTHIINDTAFIEVEITIENHTENPAGVWADVICENDGDRYTGRNKIHIPANASALVRVKVAVENVKLWDIDSPHLYKITAVLNNGEAELDRDETVFGVRTITVDSIHGFQLNGRTIKLKGGCVHHDNGILGAASFYDSEYRKMKLHKDNGYNAIRFAHNPMSGELLQACDELGLLVINEAFDVWNMGKNTNDYSQYFAEDWQDDMRAFILRDRNHPCVAIWSTGNEITERGGLGNGYEWAARLAEFVRELDPTRPVLNALCSFFSGLNDFDSAEFWKIYFMENGGANALSNADNALGHKLWPYTDSFAAPLDIVGYNYLQYHYAEVPEKYPGRVICCTESKPAEMEQYWADVMAYPFLIGDFNWTSHDYIGEAGLGKHLYLTENEAKGAGHSLLASPYPWRTGNCGDFDLCGFPRPQLAYRRIIWGSDETYIAVLPPDKYGLTEVLGGWGYPAVEHSWSWSGYEGKPVKVEVYSVAEKVALYLNGVCVGQAGAGKENHYKAVFDVPYQPGVLKAVSKNGTGEVSSDEIITAGAAAALRITLDKTRLSSGGKSLCFAVIEAVDKDGCHVPYVDYPASATVSGCAELAAFGSANPITEENYTKGSFKAYQGRLLAVVRAGFECGNAVLTVEMNGIGSASSEITVE